LLWTVREAVRAARAIVGFARLILTSAGAAAAGGFRAGEGIGATAGAGAGGNALAMRAVVIGVVGSIGGRLAPLRQLHMF